MVGRNQHPTIICVGIPFRGEIVQRVLHALPHISGIVFRADNLCTGCFSGFLQGSIIWADHNDHVVHAPIAQGADQSRNHC